MSVEWWERNDNKLEAKINSCHRCKSYIAHYSYRDEKTGGYAVVLLQQEVILEENVQHSRFKFYASRLDPTDNLLFLNDEH